MPAGTGEIRCCVLPPSHQVLSTLSFQYPLKLIASLPSAKCLTVFMLSYGGGLVSDDTIALTATLEPGTVLCLLTQGTTKIFKRHSPTHITSQTLTAHLSANSTLLLLPDPVQPFADSSYRQIQRFHLPPDDSASIIVLDWVTEGRTARGEKWDFEGFVARNEFFVGEKLMLRDAVVLERGMGHIGERMGGLTVFATLVVGGAGFKGFMDAAVRRFGEEPRIGGRDGVRGRWERVVWTAARVRGFVVVKVSGRVVEDVRSFLRELLVEEGAEEVVGRFGTGCLTCLQ